MSGGPGLGISGPVVLQLKDGVRFPQICANCASPATRPLAIEKNFASREQPNIQVFRPLFCDACIAKHRAEIPVVPLSTQLRHVLATWAMIPAVFSCALLLKFAIDITRAAVSGDKNRVIFAGICMTFFACILAWSILRIRQHAHPYLMEPSTSVTSAFYFTSDMSAAFEPAWRRYTLRNPAYAEAFGQLNQRLSWDRHNPAAERARSLRFYGKSLAYTAFGAFVLYWLYDDYLHPIYLSVRDYLQK